MFVVLFVCFWTTQKVFAVGFVGAESSLLTMNIYVNIITEFVFKIIVKNLNEKIELLYIYILSISY